MRDIATRLFIVGIAGCLLAVLLAATAASLVTTGVHVWYQLLEVMPHHQATQFTSGVAGFITVLVIMAMMFGFAHQKGTDDETAPAESAEPTTE